MPQYDSINSWLALSCKSSPLTPPPDKEPHAAQPKRKRAMSLPTSASVSSPKRRRIDNEVHPQQSVSQFGSEVSLALNEGNTFSPPASQISLSPKRASSPTRETPIILRTAWPPVLTESFNGLNETPPKCVERLGNRLADGIDVGFIPQSLRVCKI